MYSTFENLSGHEPLVLLTGRGRPINATMLGLDHWLTVWWWGMKCVINPGAEPTTHNGGTKGYYKALLQ